jgi:hypothetical protein
VSVMVIEFITLDGVVSDPDGSGRTAAGGPPAYLECLSAGQAGAGVLARYGRAAR